MSALSVLVAVTIGLYVGGLVGGFVAIPAAGVVKVLLDNYLEQVKSKRVDNEKPLNKLVKKLKNED